MLSLPCSMRFYHVKLNHKTRFSGRDILFNFFTTILEWTKAEGFFLCLFVDAQAVEMLTSQLYLTVLLEISLFSVFSSAYCPSFLPAAAQRGTSSTIQI